ncbi:bifunctional metallophosphatase/5'-nucleotidase [Ferrimonas lipolytica]|uniref:Bifunctional metallophosphatase/5'-nucleotidase n=1 Tax=Ferrimonas lipolytica TaxID=2724191 RepID=A0A6H1UFF0_9GAMM|nr:5'-nucleotidase C-terminal domain-containing protein [Ferrimonas lipolytica]QIZ77811.1 bifunctional metallophosphatase/5'-nucleotidase [Ferrimonas lipolytica]
MKIINRSLICLSIVAALSGCNDDDTKYIEVPTDPIEVPSPYSPVVAEGKVLTNTPDIVVKSDDTDKTEVTISIGATSDLHGRIFGYDYATNSEDVDAGLTRVATLLADARAQDPNIIMIDIGDTVQGNSAQLFNDDPTHPVVSSLNALDFDVWVPGNHEFNFERSFIDRNLANFNGAVLSANIKWESNSANYIRGYQIFEVDGARVAVIGLTPANVPNWEASAPSHFAGLKFEEELASTQAAMDELVAEYAPDVIVGALHLGRSGEYGAGVHDIAAAMADKFDVILAGHEHATYIESVKLGDAENIVDIKVADDSNGYVEDKSISGSYDESNRAESVKIMEPGKWGSNLAIAEIKLAKVDDKWTMVDTTLTNASTKNVAEDTTLAAQFQYVDDISKADANEVIGNVVGNFTPTSTGKPDIATESDYDGDAGRLYTTIHYAKVHDTPLMDVINKIQLDASGATISAASLFSDSSNLEDGEEYTKGKSTNLYKYDNTLLAVNISGENLKKYMEWSYTYFNQYKDGDLTISFTPGVAAYQYDQFDGAIAYTVDLSKAAQEMDAEYNITTAGERISITEIDGKPFDPAATYSLALNSYRFGSQVAKFGWASNDDVTYDSVNETVYAIRDMLTEYVIANQGIDVADFSDSLNTWSFVQTPAIEAARTDGGAGQALWEDIQEMKTCVQIDWSNAKYPGIMTSVNVKDASTYFTNTNYKDGATAEELHLGCNIEAK